MTIRKLANLLGVSDATVSLALRNHPRISRPTRERVQRLAAETGYRGNVLVNALLTQVRRGRVGASSEVIALLLEGDAMQDSPSVVEGTRIAQQRALQLGMDLQIFFLGKLGEKSAQVDRIMFNRGIRGVIVAPMSLNLKRLVFDWSHYAWAAVGYSFQQQMMNRVANAHFAGLLTCYEGLRKAGCKRIGCVLSRDEDKRARYYWHAGAKSGPYIHGGAAVPPLMFEEPFRRREFEDWFRRHRLDAVIGNYPDYAAKWITELRLDACYATLDLHDHVPWSGIRQSWGGIFSAAVDQLAGELARNEFGLPAFPQVTLIEGVWTEGASRPAKGKA
ncbi:MAG TPA: LacI family DNA-binding transcriptional regulator [Rariglobus sp.]